MSYAVSAVQPDISEHAPGAASSLALAQRCLASVLSYDYLSSGQGHQQSRRVVGDRMARRGAPAELTVDATLGLQPGAAQAPRSEDCCFPDPEQRYLWEVSRSARLTSGEEYCLAVRMKAGDREAHDALLHANLGLVVMFARRYQRPGVPVLDLIAEGNLGLLTAADRFDPERGHRFATYAKWWVRRAIQAALPRLAGVVRVPASRHAGPRAARLDAAQPLAEPEPSGDGIDEPAACEEAQLQALAGAANDDWSWGALDVNALDSQTIPAEQEPPEATMALQRLSALWRALDSLGERDRIVVCERYALVTDRVSTLDELARRFNVSIERIRQIENAAVKKLAKALASVGASADTLL